MDLTEKLCDWERVPYHTLAQVAEATKRGQTGGGEIIFDTALTRGLRDWRFGSRGPPMLREKPLCQETGSRLREIVEREKVT